MPLDDGRAARITFTDRGDGDLRSDGDPHGLGRARAALAPVPWTWLRQVHGAEVVTVDAPGAGAGAEADGAVTAAGGAALAVQAADCAPVVLVARGGAVGVVHAGWRGLAAGVVGIAVEHLEALAPGPIEAHLGPTIGPECYAFGAADLAHLGSLLGAHVQARTASGEPALDLPAAVRSTLEAAGIGRVVVHGGCTACSTRWYSHRARGEIGRHVAVAWIDGDG